VFQGCSISNVGGYAMQLHAGYSQVVGCQIHDCGSGGIVLGVDSYAYDDDGITSHDLIANNRITNVGTVMADGVPIFATLVDHTRIAGNTISGAGYDGVSLGWRFGILATTACDNVVASNDIHDVMQVLYDGGGIYTMGVHPGSVICANSIHGIRYTAAESYDLNTGRAWGQPHADMRQLDPVQGIYLDNGSGGITVYGNLIYNCEQGIFLNGDSDYWDVESNLFVDIYTLGVRLYEDPKGTNTFANNVFTWNPDQSVTLWLIARTYILNYGDPGVVFDPLYLEDRNVYDVTGIDVNSEYDVRPVAMEQHSVVADPGLGAGEDYEYAIDHEFLGSPVGFDFGATWLVY
jgi:hypothetical protein